MQTLSRKLEYIEVNIKYIMEEFSNFSAMRINFRPTKNTTVRAAFFLNYDRRSIEIYVGKIQTMAQQEQLLLDGTDDPKGDSNFELMIRFDERFIHFIEIQDIFSCDDMMKNVPICCQSIRLKKVIWEELYAQRSPVETKAKGLKHKISIVRTSHAV